MGKDTTIAKAITLDMLLLEKDIKVDLQVILQILVEKGITTKEDVDHKRTIVECYSPTILGLTKKIKELQNDVDDSYEFFELFDKMKKGKLSDDERRKLSKMVEENPTKYGSLIKDLMK